MFKIICLPFLRQIVSHSVLQSLLPLLHVSGLIFSHSSFSHIIAGTDPRSPKQKSATCWSCFSSPLFPRVPNICLDRPLYNTTLSFCVVKESVVLKSPTGCCVVSQLISQLWWFICSDTKTTFVTFWSAPAQRFSGLEISKKNFVSQLLKKPLYVTVKIFTWGTKLNQENIPSLLILLLLFVIIFLIVLPFLE